METQFYATLDAIQEHHWWYAARRKILRSVLREVHRVGVPPGTIYDLGCGVGANLPVLEEYGPTIGVDVSEEAIDFCRKRGRRNVMKADLNTLGGIADGSASVVVLADVIEHLDDEQPCLSSARRALAPGGALIVTVPAYEFLWSPADDLNHHRRRYRAPQLRQVIEASFKVEHLTYFNTFLFGLVAAGRLGEALLKRGGDDMARIPPAPVNSALAAIFGAESGLVPHRTLPFGVSLLCVARKA